MTVAVMVKVFDGLVLAADSATTIPLSNGAAQVYNSANKVFQLHREFPVGAVTWGLGSLGPASIATVAKVLRARLMGQDEDFAEWSLDSGYTVEQVAGRAVELLFDELFEPQWQGQQPVPQLGFLVAGYSWGADLAEAFLVTLEDPNVRPVPELVTRQEESGWIAFAQPQATTRLFHGYDPALREMLRPVLAPAEMAKVEAALGSLYREAVIPAMPFADAIKFAEFLVETTAGYSHWLLGPDTVGGPTEVAGISKFEGFKWISRKHYYGPDLNRWETRR